MMFRRIPKSFLVVCFCAGLVLTNVRSGQAAGFGVKGGIGILQQDDLNFGGTTTGPTLWMVGGYVDLGGVVSSRVRIVPGVDYSSRSRTRVTSFSLEARYQFFQGPKSVVYVGMGPGINVIRTAGTLASSRTIRGSLNVPIGVELKLGKGGARWTFEMKMAIADNQRDSSYRLGTGFAFVIH